MQNAILADIFGAALDAADPVQAVLSVFKVENGMLLVSGRHYDLDAYSRIVVIGAGKASSKMAVAIEMLLGSRIDAGLVIVKIGHAEKLLYIEQVEASHPIPDHSGMMATRRILDMAREADERTLILCLLSGGASALLSMPAPGLSLEDKQAATYRLLNAGASISETNAVRKHISSIKGGQLARAAYPAQIISLVISDVIGDRIDVIASGPTSKDDSTFLDAFAIAEKYGLPERILEHLRRGIQGEIPETPKEDMPNVNHVIAASNRQALEAAREKATLLGFDVQIVTDRLQGEARTAARDLAEKARANLFPGRKLCLISGGETTVTVNGKGKGGRNQEFALAFCIEIDGEAGIALLSAGTDGTDGPTDAAGAYVDGSTAHIAKGLGIDPCVYLDHNDSYGFFSKLEALSGIRCHYKTGPTGTNVMDIQILLLQA